jgi:hypothetical protein
MKPFVALLAFVCVSCAFAQNVQKSADVPFAGCYEVTSLSWTPGDDTITLIPKRFLLSAERHVAGGKFFRMRTLDPDAWHPIDTLWAWRPQGNQVEVSWSTGFGSFSGKLKPSGSGELVGKLKERCDYRCDFKKRTGKMRVQRIGCNPE